MIRFIRDAQPPNTQFKQGMVRDLGAALNASFIASGDAVDAVEPDRTFPPAQRLLPAGVADESPVPALTGREVLQNRALVSRAQIVASDTGTDWLNAPTLLSFSAVLDSGTATTVLLEVRDSVGTVATAATIVADVVAQTLRQSLLLRQQSEYRLRRSSGTGSVTITV